MTDDPRSDRELLAGAARGDAGAFAALYDRHSAAVHRAALRAAGNAQDAADATQEAFVHVLERARELELTCRLSTYLYPVVTRIARRARERASRESASGEAFLAAVESLGGSVDERGGAERRSLALVLAALPEAQREALLLRFADGLSVRECAIALECPEGTVRSRVHNGLIALRRVPDLARRLGLE